MCQQLKCDAVSLPEI